MNVLMVEPSGRGGLAHYTKMLVEAFWVESAVVELLTSRPYEFQDRVSFPVRDGLLQMATPWHLKLKLFWAADRLYRAFYNSAKIYWTAKKLRPSIVHHQLVIALTDQFFLPLLNRSYLLVLTVHDVRPHRPGIESSEKFYRRIYQRADRIIVHTEKNREDLLGIYPELAGRVAVIPHGTAEAREIPERHSARARVKVPQNRFCLLFFGTIRANKGLDVLLRALALMNEANPSTHLLIAGSLPRGEGWEKYADLIANLGLVDHVTTDIRFIPEELTPDYFAAADLIVLPYSEGFMAQSGVLMQAYAYGVPTVVTHVGGLGEAVLSDSLGVVVPPSDPQALALAFCKLIRNPELMAEMKENAKKAAKEKYAWAAVAEQTLNLYKEVLKEKENAGFRSHDRQIAGAFKD